MRLGWNKFEHRDDALASECSAGPCSYVIERNLDRVKDFRPGIDLGLGRAFLRARQAKLHEEEHRLQMVSEMSKRLGTNVSKFELESLRNQVASLTHLP